MFLANPFGKCFVFALELQGTNRSGGAGRGRGADVKQKKKSRRKRSVVQTPKNFVMCNL